MKGRHWSDRVVRERLKRLSRRERYRKLDVLRKTPKSIVELAWEYNAVVVVDASRHKRVTVERQR